MKKAAIIIGALLIVVCGGGGLALKAYQASVAKAQVKESDFAKVERSDLTVQVVETGTIDAVKSVEVKSRVSGRLAHLYVEEGDRVRKGQLIAVIDPQETQLRVKQDQAQLKGARASAAKTGIEISQRRITAKAGYDRAKAHVAQLRQELRIQPTLTQSGIRSAETAYASAKRTREQLETNSQPNERTSTQSAYREAEVNYENTERELHRKEGLLGKGYVAQRDVDDARLQFELARTRRDSAKDRLARLNDQQRMELQQADEKIKQTRAELDSALANRIQDDVKRQEFVSALASQREAEASLRDVETLQKSRLQGLASVEQIGSVLSDSMRQLGETAIRSPLDGIVTKKVMQEGELVASLSSFSSGTPIVRIEDRGALRVKLDINEIDVAKLTVGMKSLVTVDAIPEQDFEGTVKRIAPASKQSAQPAQGESVVKYEVEIWLRNASSQLRSGMSAKCTLQVLKHEQVLTLPVAFVGKDASGRFVMLAGRGPKPAASRHLVRVGASTGAKVEIISGLQEGQRVAKLDYKGPARKGAMNFNDDEGQ